MSYTITAHCSLTYDIMSQIDELISECQEYELYAETDSPNGESCFYTAYDNDKLIGFLSFLWIPGDDEAEITAYVQPAMRHKGVFTAMLQAARTEAGRLNITTLYYCAAVESNHYDRSKYLRSEYLMSIDYEKSIRMPCCKLPSYISVLNTLDTDGTYSLISTASGCIISTCHIDMEPMWCNIWGVYTIEAERNKGYGTMLILQLIKDYYSDIKNRMLPLILQVSGRNTTAMRLYRNCGFEITQQSDYYQV